MKRLYILYLFATLFTAVDAYAQMPDSIYQYFPMDSNGTYWMYRAKDLFSGEVYYDEIFEIIGDTAINNASAKKVKYALIDYNVDGHGKSEKDGPYIIHFFFDKKNWIVYWTRCRPTKDQSCDDLGVFINFMPDTASVTDSLYDYRGWAIGAGNASVRITDDNIGERKYQVGYKSDSSFAPHDELTFQQKVGWTRLAGLFAENELLLVGYRNEFGGSGSARRNFWKYFDSLASVGDDSPSEDNVMLYFNYPNPITVLASTVIRYHISKPTDVQLTVYNTMGQIVEVLKKDHLLRGEYYSFFSSKNHPAGTYFYELRTGNERLVKQMVILK